MSVKPSDHVRRGECPFCHGHGEIHTLVPFEQIRTCPLCLGTKHWPPPEEKKADARNKQADCQ
jgi:excinuclease UvrABC ATPase subunit